MTGAEINIEDDGTVFIGSSGGEGADEAARMIDEIANPRPVLVGETYEGRVVKTTTFGAFVNLVPGRDGLVHISKLGKGKRLSSVEEAVKEGDDLTVLVEDIDPQGKISLKPIGPEWEAPEGAEHRGRATAAGVAERWRIARDRGSRPPRQGKRFRDRESGGDRTERASTLTDVDHAHRVHLGSACRDGADARRPLRLDRHLGARRLARRAAGDQRPLPLPRAPAVQGHRPPHGPGHRGGVRRGRRRRERVHRQGVHVLLRARARPRPRDGGRPPGRHARSTRRSRRPTSRPSPT